MEIRLPEICGGTESEQLAMMQSYLYTLAQQLQFAFDAVSDAQQQAETRIRAQQPQTPAGTFGAIKSLIIKSAEIVDSYSQQIDRKLEGKYVAQSDYGTFVRDTEQRITENSREITQAFRDLRVLTDGVDSVKDAMLEVNASIRTGLLQDAEPPVYGVEIGQQEQNGEVITFRRFARLTADKLSFYDGNGSEVAYISDYRLHIIEAEIGTLEAGQIGAPQWNIGAYRWQAAPDGHLTLT